MNFEEHQDHHAKLHRAFDELFADYVRHHPDRTVFLEMPVRQLIEWSHQQTLNPTPAVLPTGEIEH